jgi:hypothetical protein
MDDDNDQDEFEYESAGRVLAATFVISLIVGGAIGWGVYCWMWG